jgi:hypothetical protein
MGPGGADVVALVAVHHLVAKQLLDPDSYGIDLALYVVDLRAGGGSGGRVATEEGRLRLRRPRG